MVSARKTFAIIIATTREPRVGPAITQLAHKHLTSFSDKTDFKVIDIRDFNLPLLDEPVIAQQITSSDGYKHEHTRKWSREMYKYDGFVFVTAQYNWGIPGSLKNAIDFLFNEWKGKPAFIISYGGHGGGKAAEQLAQVCQGCRMTPWPERVAFPFHGHEGMLQQASRGTLLDNAEELWKTEIEGLKTSWTAFEKTLYEKEPAA